MSRAISTVVDVTLFLLFVGAAAATLVHSVHLAPATTETPAAERAELLATTTETVEYTLSPPSEAPSWIANATARERRIAHGTVAELLAEAAMSRAKMQNRQLSSSGVAFERAVGTVTTRLLRGPEWKSAVRVRWEPYRGASLNGTLRVGDTPPPTADVHAAVLTVPVSAVNARGQAHTPTREYRPVADSAARAVVAGLFPRLQSRRSISRSYPSARITVERYDRFTELLDVAPPNPESVNERVEHLRNGLTDVFVRDMRHRFDSPNEAASAVRAGQVRIVVRTWQP